MYKPTMLDEFRTEQTLVLYLNKVYTTSTNTVVYVPFNGTSTELIAACMSFVWDNRPPELSCVALACNLYNDEHAEIEFTD